jgi:hypothetical protein
MAGVSIQGTVLDHVAHAVHRWQDVWTRYAVDLGAEWNSGGPGPGFAPGQLRFRNGARVELLMPWDTEVNDFLARFIANNGPGPHHLTFKVPDLAAALEKVRAAGFDPIGIDFSHPEWLEAFIHPKQATGVVVQLAEAPVPWSSPPPDDYPPNRRQWSDGSGPMPPASLRWVVHAVADLAGAVGLFVDLLGGTVADQGSVRGHQWMDVTWDGPLGVRLVAAVDPSSPNQVSEWLEGRPGRIHHLRFSAQSPSGLPDVQPTSAALPGLGRNAAPTACWKIAAEDNAGLRLVISPS